MREKILVIHQGALGDVILSFPALLALKEERGACLAMLCKDQIGKVACDLGVATVHFPVERARFSGLFAKDTPLDMQAFIDDYDAAVLIGFSDDMSRRIRQHHRGRTYRIAPRPPSGEEVHVAGHIRRQLEIKGLLRNSDDWGVRHGERETWASRTKVGKGKIGARASSLRHGPVEDSLSLREQDPILIHPGAGSRRKRWSVNNFIALAGAVTEMNGEKAVFLLGPAESDLLPVIKKRVEGKFQIHQLQDLSAAMTFMKAAKCFIGNDSGLAHLAAMMGVPTVAIFGPSSPKRWRPVGKAVKVLRGAPDCAPCFETGKTNCHEPQCLRGVSVDMVLEAAKAVA